MTRLMVAGIRSVGLVDAGDDPEAVLTFWKSKATGGTGEQGEDMGDFSLADLSLDETQAEALDVHIAEVTADAVAKALEDKPEVIQEDDILKGASDEVKARIDELEDELSDDEKERLTKSIPDIIADTPKSEVAVTRFKKAASKAGDIGSQMLWEVLKTVTTEAVKKSMFG